GRLSRHASCETRLSVTPRPGFTANQALESRHYWADGRLCLQQDEASAEQLSPARGRAVSVCRWKRAQMSGCRRALLLMSLQRSLLVRSVACWQTAADPITRPWSGALLS